MNKTPSPFCIDTHCGQLELTKGSYLTLLKRKNEVFGTVKKTKHISYPENRKKTVLKTNRRRNMRNMTRSSRFESQIALKDRSCNIMLFSVGQDRQCLDTKMLIPSIPIAYDNDDETKWIEVEENVKSMSLALALSAYDRTYRR